MICTRPCANRGQSRVAPGLGAEHVKDPRKYHAGCYIEHVKALDEATWHASTRYRCLSLRCASALDDSWLNNVSDHEARAVLGAPTITICGIIRAMAVRFEDRAAAEASAKLDFRRWPADLTVGTPPAA